MCLFDERMYSPKHLQATKTSWYQNKKLVKPSQKKSNFGSLLLCSNAPTRPRPCQSITLIYFHHPPIILELYPFNFLSVLEELQEYFVLLLEEKVHRVKICFFHNLENMHPFSKLFHGRCIWMIVTFSRNFNKLQYMVSKISTSTTYNHF